MNNYSEIECGDSLRTQFKRTKCDCALCKTPCRHMPGSLAPGDLNRILKAVPSGDTVEETEEWIEQHFMASEGALVRDRTTGKQFRVPTLTPAQKDDGNCIFLDEEGHCGIHEVAPFGCAYNDLHMTTAEGQAVSYWLLVAQMADHEYFGKLHHVIKHLEYLGITATPLADRRANFEADLKEVERANADVDT